MVTKSGKAGNVNMGHRPKANAVKAILRKLESDADAHITAGRFDAFHRELDKGLRAIALIAGNREPGKTVNKK